MNKTQTQNQLNYYKARVSELEKEIKEIRIKKESAKGFPKTMYRVIPQLDVAIIMEVKVLKEYSSGNLKYMSKYSTNATTSHKSNFYDTPEKAHLVAKNYKIKRINALKDDLEKMEKYLNMSFEDIFEPYELEG